MGSIRQLIPAVVLATVASVAAYAATEPSQPSSAGATAGSPWHGHRHGALGSALQKLNLSADQRNQIQSIYAQAKPRFKSLQSERRTNLDALATTPPTDPGYPALVAAAQSNAAAGVQLRADIWSQIHAVLTPDQQAKIPGLVAQAKAERQARRAAWQARHSAS
jgi:Spy/CpxP family protein refolding chaperone